ncbi:hydroxyisourate hydrolase, partial [Streptomyces sp. UNOC14_S4]|uniref:hydroxyisourate hydrolase n=1 Tax=Streptomyces sp. UNOC14_S4 TaxID=2872340 RepID=UPI001E2B9048
VSGPASDPAPDGGTAAAVTVSTHVLDTTTGRPAAAVAVELSARDGENGAWEPAGTGVTDADGRCRGLPALPPGASHARLVFAVGPYLARGPGRAFFPEAAVAFAVTPGEHYHVPLLLNPFGYSVYRGS